MTASQGLFAIVTGTSRGIGAALARALVDAGWDVLGVARSEAPTELAPRGSSPTTGRYQHARLDLADLTQAPAWFRTHLPRLPAFARARRVALVNNAGVLGEVVPATELDPLALARAYAVNTVLPTWLAGFVLAQTDARTAVRIVHLGSGAATSAYPGWSAYCGSKAALRISGEVLARELEETPALAGRDVAVVDFAPNVVATDMQAELRAADPARFPRRDRFVALHTDGELFAPEAPAARLVELLGQDDLPVYSSERFAG